MGPLLPAFGGSVVKNLPANAGDAGLIPGLGRSPWRRKWQAIPVLLPGKSHGQRGAWRAAAHGVTVTESDNDKAYMHAHGSET